MNEPLTDLIREIVSLVREALHAPIDGGHFRSEARKTPATIADARLGNRRFVTMAKVIASSGGMMLYQIKALDGSRLEARQIAIMQIARKMKPGNAILSLKFKYFRPQCAVHEVKHSGNQSLSDDTLPVSQCQNVYL